MAAVATAETRVAGPERDGRNAPTPRLFNPQGPTLEDAIVATWEKLATAGHAPCPVCGGEMSNSGGCERCGSELR
jgi:hypothetical protein